MASDMEKRARLGKLEAITADAAVRIPALVARGLIRLYRYTLSSIAGRTCRHLPTCSEYAEQAIAQHGLWAGAWMGLARIWRCRPGGSHGFDPVPDGAPPAAIWYAPWRYGQWGSVNLSARGGPAPHRAQNLREGE